jgi:hypothetical protein
MDPLNPYAAPAAPPGEVGLEPLDQPLTLLGALNVGTSLYFRLFPTLAAISLSVWAPVEFFLTYQEYFVVDPDNALSVFRMAMLADATVGVLATGACISVAAAALRGERRGWLAGLGDGFRNWPRLFGTRLVVGIVLLLAALALIVPALYLAVRYALAESIAVIESQGGTKAIGRSMELTRGRFLVFLGLCAATIVPLLVVGAVVQLPLAMFPAIDHWLLSAALTCLIDLAEPWATLVFVAAYLLCVAEERRGQARVKLEVPKV